jgi:hypothetical protein
MVSSYSAFQEEQFRRRVDKALKTVATILENQRTPRYAQEIDHKYDDKFALANFMTNTAIASYTNVLERMGMDQDKLEKLCKAVHEDKRSVTLRFAAEDSCGFLFEKDVNVLMHDFEQSTESSESTNRGVLGTVASNKSQTTKTKVSKKIKEFHWDIGVSYKLYCFTGNDPKTDPIMLEERSSSCVIVTTGTKKAPIHETTVHPFVDVNLTWLFEQISPKTHTCLFEIDRSLDSCKTPRRNQNVDAAFLFFADFKKWSALCFQHFRNRVEHGILDKHEEDHVRSRIEKNILGRKEGSGTSTPPVTTPPSLSSLNAEGIFCPILPLFEEASSNSMTGGETTGSLVVLTSNNNDGVASPLLSIGDIDKFLNEQTRQLDEAKESMAKMYPSSDKGDKIITTTEASLALLWHHTQFLTIAYGTGIDYIEMMLRKQLIAAIGKTVGKKEFDEFIQFHGKKLFKDEYIPSPFCYAIRRPNHYPDGVVTIESNDATEKIDPIETTVNYLEDGPSMFVPINAATSIEITGKRYLHGWIQHKFESSLPGGHVMPISDYNLTARARQFSCFLVMTGTISGPNEFTPRDAIVLQNKDEVMIPLLLNELPTAKEFKDAISSLSPEQQQFAKAFRGMQLESSVFGVCVIQLKPQLEVLLGLPPDALLKEIRLTQDLLSLFIDYQIPSDLLSFDGERDAPLAEKVAAVKEHVKAVMNVIDDAKKKQLDEAEKKAEMNVYKHVADAEMCDDGRETSPAAFGGPARMMKKSMAFASAAVPTMAFGSTLSTPMMASAPMHVHVEGNKFSPVTRSLQMQVPTESTQQFDADFDSTGKSASQYRESYTSTSHAKQIGRTSLPPGTIDFTAIPKQLDSKFEAHDTDSALRPTIIKTDSTWSRLRQENLLTKAQKSSLGPEEIKSEKSKAFDLLDALSRSGSLPIACAELHVVVAVTHCFEKDVMNTVIQDNVNPIEKVEKTMLLMTSTIQNVPPSTLLADEVQSARLTQSFPALFAEEE